MTTEESIFQQISKLTELELAGLLENVNEYLRKSKLQHLGLDQRIIELEEELEELKAELDEANEKLEDIRNIL